MWNRKNSFERRLDTMEGQAVDAVGRLADGIQDRLSNPAGEQLASNLRTLASRVEDLGVGDQVYRRRRELEKASKKASRQVERAMHDFDKTRGRVVGEAGALASRVEKRAERTGQQLAQTGQQLATISQRTVPEEPTGWILPSLLGFGFGFGFGFIISRLMKPSREERHA